MNQSDLSYLSARLEDVVRATLVAFDAANPRITGPTFKQRLASILSGKAHVHLPAVAKETEERGYVDDVTKLFIVPGVAEAAAAEKRRQAARDALSERLGAERRAILDNVKLGKAADALAQLRAFEKRWAKPALAMLVAPEKPKRRTRPKTVATARA